MQPGTEFGGPTDVPPTEDTSSHKERDRRQQPPTRFGEEPGDRRPAMALHRVWT